MTGLIIAYFYNGRVYEKMFSVALFLLALVRISTLSAR